MDDDVTDARAGTRVKISNKQKNVVHAVIMISCSTCAVVFGALALILQLRTATTVTLVEGEINCIIINQRLVVLLAVPVIIY